MFSLDKLQRSIWNVWLRFAAMVAVWGIAGFSVANPGDRDALLKGSGIRVSVSEGVLRIENRETMHTYDAPDGKPLRLLQMERNGPQALSMGFPGSGDPFELPVFAPEESSALPDGYELRWQRLSPRDPLYLELTIPLRWEGRSCRQIVRVFPESPLLEHRFEFLAKGADAAQADPSSAQRSREMVESTTPEPQSVQLPLAEIPLHHPHDSLRVVSFREATDHNDTLVFEQEFRAYRAPVQASGAFALLHGPEREAALLVVKLAPLTESQSDYPGYDFEFSERSLRIAGLAPGAADIEPDTWYRGYGFALGLTGCNPTRHLSDLRVHQKQIRTLIPDRDLMVLANTWGDRSRDSRMNEAFILQELEACAAYGISFLQLDDGWQQGLSRNSANRSGQKWEDWEDADWVPHRERFPSGFDTILSRANELGIEIGLWFNPSRNNAYARWERDADLLIRAYHDWGIRVFKIDGIELTGKRSEENLRQFFEKVNRETGGDVVFNVDVTAGHRMGYFYMTEYGNVFLENRYTDWGNYYPHRTLRNLWMLAKYVAPEKLQIEFLNKWRNPEQYGQADPLAPIQVPLEYQFAQTLVAQPLAWMEVSSLPGQARSLSAIIQQYRLFQAELHKGITLPIGWEPNGYAWTGFQSMIDDQSGFLLVYRQAHESAHCAMPTHLPASTGLKLQSLLGLGQGGEVQTDEQGRLEVFLPEPMSYAVYHYQLLK